MFRVGVLPLVLFIFSGCDKSVSERNGDTRQQSSETERIVREVIAMQFKVNPQDIDMTRRLSAAPFKADDLDLVELVMCLEERLVIEIPDSIIEKHAGGKLGQATRLSASQLVTIIEESKARPSRKRN